MTISAASSFVFLFLFLCYVAQLIQLVRKLHSDPSPASLDDIWIFLGLSLLIPIAVSLLPELMGEGINSSFAGGTVNAGSQGAGAFFLEASSRFLASYLVTIVTLELSLQAQVLDAKAENPWVGLLLLNLGLDVASIVVIRLFMAIPTGRSDTATLAAFAIFAVPTVLTGALVVAVTYAVLKPKAAR